MSSPASNEYLALVSGFEWSKMMVCLVVFNVSGRGRQGGRRDFGPGLVLGIVVAGLGLEEGVVGAGVVGVGFCLLQCQCVTGMKVEVIEA